MSLRRFRKHFRKNHSKKSHGHPTLVFRKDGNEYVYIGLTHSPITDGKKNIRLFKNPNPIDKRPSFIRPFYRRDLIKMFSTKKLRFWKMSKKDRHKIRKVQRTRE